jgi:hypothetical protein
MLLGLAINYSIVEWKPDPIWVLFYMRGMGPVFYLNHYSSTMAITMTMLFFALKDPPKAFKTAIPILSTVGIHEIILDVLQFQGSLSFSYILEWLLWIGLGVYLATKEQRKTLLEIFILITFYTFAWDALITSVLHHDVSTIIHVGTTGFAPGPMYLDPLDNVLEVFSWLLPLSLWYLPKKAVWVKEFEYHE